MSFIDIFDRSLTTSHQPIRSKSDRAKSLEAIEGEILREKADALRRVGERLEEALDVLDSVREAFDRIEERLRDRTSPTEEAASLRKARADLAGRLAAVRHRAYGAHRDLIIQREAVGLRSHLDVERCYRISERLR
jgi:hypothetical protein